MKNFLLIISLICILIGITPALDKKEMAEENFLKGVAIKKISKYIEWPPEEEHYKSREFFVIGVKGSPVFFSVLKSIYGNNKIKDRIVKIVWIKKNVDILDCNILYIGNITINKLEKVLKFAERKPILTISAAKGFADNGVHININVKDKRIRFEINETNVTGSGIKVSSMLLRLAKIIDPLDRN